MGLSYKIRKKQKTPDLNFTSNPMSKFVMSYGKIIKCNPIILISSLHPESFVYMFPVGCKEYCHMH